MLSPGKWHERVPRDPIENLKFRKWLLQKASGNKRVQAALAYICSQDILFFINFAVWQFNPNAFGRGSPKFGPFVTWPYQEDSILADDTHEDGPGILWCIENRQAIIFEKSREMGATWLCLLVATWIFLYKPREKTMVISRSAEAVDKSGDEDALFPKIDFVLDHLPDWLLNGYDRDEGRKTRLFRHPSRAAIAGQTTSEKSGVSGRAYWIFIDELSQIDAADEVLNRTANVSRCRVFVGTHKGTGTTFYNLTDRKHALGSFIKKRVLHWSMHPDKKRGLYRYNPACKSTNGLEVLDEGYQYPPDYEFILDGSPLGGPWPGIRSPWYDDISRTMSPRGIAEDLDINPSGSLTQYFDISVISRLLSRCFEAPFHGDVTYDPDTAKIFNVIPQKDGPFKLWVPLDIYGTPPKSRYTIGCDISQGRGETNSCMSVYDMQSLMRVGEYITPFLKPFEFAYRAVAIASLFKTEDGQPAGIVWEKQGPGGEFGQKVLELGHKHVYYKTEYQKTRHVVSDTPGWNSNSATQTQIFGWYREALYEGKFFNPSTDALEECLDIREIGGRIEHAVASAGRDKSGARQSHADRVVADALAFMFARDLGLGRGLAEKEKEVPHIGSLEGRRKFHEKRDRELEDELEFA